MFLAVVTRPDIAFAVNSASKYLSNHNDSHCQAVKKNFRYLVGTTKLGILYTSGESMLEFVWFSDSDFASHPETRRSTTGYAFCKMNGIISWASQRQRLVTVSTTEAEYVAAATAAKEALWLRKLLRDLGCLTVNSTVLKVDNLSAIKLVKILSSIREPSVSI